MDSIASEIGSQVPTQRVSVILPTYNRERYLPEAIASVFAQTLHDLELIIVDDGSTDSTAALVGAIADERVRYIALPHRGLCAALNAGLRAARGEFIARLDSDDVFLPEALTTLVAALSADSGIDVVWAKGQLMNSEGRDQPRWRELAGAFPGRDVALARLRRLHDQPCDACSTVLHR